MKYIGQLSLRVIIAMMIIIAGISCSDIVSSDKKILLWPEGAPGAKGRKDQDKPSLTVYLPRETGPTMAAVVICPGGAYARLSMGHEGHSVAKWLNSLEVAGIVLKYRLPKDGYIHPAPLQDAQRAIGIVRSKAAEWNLNVNKIGIMGFSAGGHLASTVGTHFHCGRKEGLDPIDQISCRPDFMILIYPIITMQEFTHNGAKRNLLGTSPDQKLVDNLSNELQVTSETPPTFLVHTSDDKVVLSENSVNFYLALRKAGVSAELHIYNKGGHGFGIGKAKSVVGASWQNRCSDWMRAQGIID
jgi:acetyl esterase/lipase